MIALQDKEWMMRKLFVLLLTLTLIGLAAPAGATTTRVAFTGSQQTIAIDNPGESWLSGPVLHVRNRELSGLVFPDPVVGLPQGTSEATLHFNLNTTTFEGRVWGKGRLDFGDGGFATTFEGNVGPANVPGGMLGEFQVVGHGYGILEGTQIRVSVQEYVALGFSTFTGSMFTPGDK